MWIARMCVLCVAWIIASSAMAIEYIKIPLAYQAQTGFYTTQFIFGPQSQPIEMTIDTVSPYIVLLGNQSICPTCSPKATKGAYHFYQDSSYGALESMQSLTGTTRVLPNTDLVRLNQNIALQFPFKVIVSGIRTESTLGLQKNMSNENAAGKEKLFWHALAEKYGVEKTITFVLCKNKGASFVLIGKRPSSFPPIKASLTLNPSPYYMLTLNEIRSGVSQQVIAKPVITEKSKTILDSNLSGGFLVGKILYHNMINYLKQTTAKKLPIKLTDDFWDGGCTDKKNINLSVFPELQFRFSGANGQSIDLPLKPAQYFTPFGCPKGQIQFIFSHAGQDKAPYDSRDKSYNTNSILFGTPFFEAHGISITTQSKAKIHFFSNETLCNVRNP